MERCGELARVRRVRGRVHHLHEHAQPLERGALEAEAQLVEAALAREPERREAVAVGAQKLGRRQPTAVHARAGRCAQDASDNPNKALGILAGCANDKLFTEGSWNAAFCEKMTPKPGDIVVQGKKGLDSFPGTDLEETLKAKGIETVALAGFLTNCCVESTMRCVHQPRTAGVCAGSLSLRPASPSKSR